jgi:hypothetical protein
VGASLLAKAIFQSLELRLVNRIREQTHSYNGSGVL